MVEVVGVEVLAFAEVSRHLTVAAVVASALPCRPVDVSIQLCRPHIVVAMF